MNRFSIATFALLTVAIYVTSPANASTTGPTVTTTTESGATANDIALLSKMLTERSADLTGVSRVEIKKIAFRPGGTPATLRQLGGRDSIRLTIHRDSSVKELVIHQRSEGLNLSSAAHRKARLFALCARKITEA